MELKLSHRGFLLIGVPLIFQMALLLTLHLFLSRLSADNSQAAADDAAMRAGLNLTAQAVSAQSHLSAFNATGDKKQAQDCRRALNSMQSNAAAMQKALSSPADRERQILEQMPAVSQALENAVSSRDPKEGYRGVQLLNRLIMDLCLFVDSLEQKQSVSLGVTQKLLHLIEQIMFTAAILMALLSFCLVVFFNRGTTDRLAILMENIVRLSKKQALQPVITGTDELARLDAVFHEMAARLEEASCREREFMQMISHDVRSPLTSVVAALHMLSNSEIPVDKRRRSAQLAQTSIERVVKLVNELLDVEKLESGHFDLAISQCSALEMVGQAVQTLEPAADSKKITFAVLGQDRSVPADADRIVQVLVNLVGNALKFSEPGTTITIGIEEMATYLQFSVKDTGRGMPETMLDKVFDRFRQVEFSDGKRHGGTGLGLAICKGLVEAHGGVIGVESRLGQGSTFWFRLPLTAADESQKNSPCHVDIT